MNTPREILIEALGEMGADGLVNEAGECGCPLDQLCPLGDCLDLDECIPGRFIASDDPGADLDILQQWPEGYYVPLEARP